MIALAAICLLIGSILGLRFSVLALVPGIAFGLFAAATAGFAQGQDLGTVALTMVSIAAGLQLGYLAGAAVQHAVATARERFAALSHPAH